MFDSLMQDPSLVVLGAVLLAALSGVPGLLLRPGESGQKLASLLAVAASALALPALISLLVAGKTSRYVFNWGLPFGPTELSFDPLSLLFLIPIFLVFPLGSLYALGYWPNASRPSTGPSLTFFYGLLSASMALVVLAHSGPLLLMAWEVMALSGFFLVLPEHESAEVRGAATIYLVASHVGVAGLFVLFSELRMATGSFLFPETGSLALAGGAATVVFLAALVGFGSKAGLMPLHIWLPAAHANAPSHVSALLSGVMLKMGIYGLLRVLSFFGERPLWWGGTIVVLGLVSALLGIAIAAVQKDFKRLLAYSSIENLGLVAAGIGMALIGQGTGNPRLAYLGMAGALFHLLNHSMFKPLLFFSAGSVLHATGTRDLDLMGGLGKRLPRTALLSLLGAAAICGLPPFNGFASEFLLYLGFLGEARAPQPYLALGVPVLALVGGVAAISFVKLYGITFLGAPRSEAAAHGHEAPAAMILPMAVLGALCLVGGVCPGLFLALVQPALATVVPQAAGFAGLPFSLLWFAGVGIALLILALGLSWLLRRRQQVVPAETGPTWGCGYLAPTPRMEYTGSSFGLLFGSFSSGVVRTRVSSAAPRGLVPGAMRAGYLPEETLLERLILPALGLVGIAFRYLRRVQHGEVHLYIIYIFVTLLVLMIWVR